MDADFLKKRFNVTEIQGAFSCDNIGDFLPVHEDCSVGLVLEVIGGA